MYTKNVTSPMEGEFISHFHLNLNVLTYQVVYWRKFYCLKRESGDGYKVTPKPIRSITEINPFLHGQYYWDNLFIFVYIVE